MSHPLFLNLSWGEFLLQVARNPQNYVLWLVVILLVLYLTSRLRNILEERSVNRAIYISRGLVGTFNAFLILPVALYLLLNVMALVHGVTTIGIGFLGKWLGLTVTSYWWLLRCAFNSADLINADQIYSVNSLIRILWILLPFSIIWLRTSRTRVGKLFLIPLIIGTLVITRYKFAPPTFLTEDTELLQKIPMLNRLNFISSNALPTGGNATAMLSEQQRKIVAGILGFLVAIGFIVGLGLAKRVPGLLLVAVGIMGFLLIAPHQADTSQKVPDKHKEHYGANLQALIHKMDSVHQIDNNSLEVYDLSMRISAAYQARIEMGEVIRFPDSLCNRYHAYFYDWCKE